MTRIFLIGYMGSGKTTYGRAAAKALGLSFLDLDIYIEERFFKSVSDIFAEKAVPAFRNIICCQAFCKFVRIFRKIAKRAKNIFLNIDIKNYKRE